MIPGWDFEFSKFIDYMENWIFSQGKKMYFSLGHTKQNLEE